MGKGRILRLLKCDVWAFDNVINQMRLEKFEAYAVIYDYECLTKMAFLLLP